MNDPSTLRSKPQRAPRTLGATLLRLTLATVLPLIAFAALATFALVQRERETFQRGAQERVRALSSAVDAELHSTIETLRALAQANSLEQDDLDRFYLRASRVVRGQPDWFALSLVLPSGEQVLNTMRPWGEALPPAQERASFDELLRTRAPVVGRLFHSAFSGRSNFAVRVPVLREGEVRYVLSAIVDPASIKRILDAQRFPADWIGVVLDAGDHIVARTVTFDATLGKPASDSLRAALAGAREGWFRGSTIEGDAVYTPFIRSAQTGFAVAQGIPASAVDAVAWQAFWGMTSGASAALALALCVAWWLGRRISAPIEALARQARLLAAGETPEAAGPAPGHTHEMAQLASAFEQAGVAVRERATVQRRLAAVTDNATVALFMMDEQAHCTFMNPAAEAMTGYALFEARGRTLHDLIHHHRPDGSAYPIEQCPIHRPLAEHASGEETFVHRSGRHVPVAYSAGPIRAGDAVVGTIVEARDISEARRIEAERAELLAREQRARAEAESANRAKDEFLAMLGHELRNPLGAISNATHLLEMRPAEETATRAQGVIKRQVQHLARLVDDLLDAGRVATGKIALARAPVDLAEVLRRVAAALGGAGHTAQHEVVLDVQPAWVDGDETRLEQVASNLLSNAARYTPAGGRIVVRSRAEGRDAVFEVTDDGIGMAADLLPRIFNLFVQGERGIERAQGGLGIGLTLVRRLVELHGGSVVAASDGAGHGSTFRVTLPRIETPALVAVPAEPSQGLGRRNVLVVEDNDDAREMLASALRAAGHEVHERADGDSGAAAALALGPDVALVDIGLPGANGYEVARRVRAHPAGRTMWLVALTGYGQPEDRLRALEAGFDVHAAKPIDAPTLLRLVALGRRSAPSMESADQAERAA